MKFTKETPDYEVQGWKEDAQHFLAQNDRNNNATFHRTPQEHQAVIQEWQDALESANAEMARRQKSA